MGIRFIAVAEWESRVVVECNEINGFHIAVVNTAENEEFISQNDLLLLSKVKVIVAFCICYMLFRKKMVHFVKPETTMVSQCLWRYREAALKCDFCFSSFILS